MRRSTLILATLGLFAVWSNSFVAMSFLLGSEAGARRLDWVSLTAARFLPAAAICGLWCAIARRRDAVAVLRAHPVRLVACGAMMVPGYNFALYYGQQHGVPAPVASLTTALVPLFVMLLAVPILGETIGREKSLGFAVSFAGMLLVATARGNDGGTVYPALVATVAIAPLCWSVYSVISKPIAGRIDPVLWTYLGTAVGGAMILPLLALPGVRDQWRALDAAGHLAVAYLVLPCTVLGFAVWTWLLRHLPASSVGFTVFLNPPMTLASKFLLATAFPATFLFTVRTGEWIGGVVTLAGLAIALDPRRRGRRRGAP